MKSGVSQNSDLHYLVKGSGGKKEISGKKNLSSFGFKTKGIGSRSLHLAPKKSGRKKSVICTVTMNATYFPPTKIGDFCHSHQDRWLWNQKLKSNTPSLRCYLLSNDGLLVIPRSIQQAFIVEWWLATAIGSNHSVEPESVTISTSAHYDPQQNSTDPENLK